MGAHFARRITRYIGRYFAWSFAREDVGTQNFLHLEILAVHDEGGDVKRNYLILGFALLGMSVAVLAQDPAAKPAPKKAAAAKGSPTKGKEVFDQKCSVCHFADSDAKKIGPGIKRNFQARHVYREQQQSHRRQSERPGSKTATR